MKILKKIILSKVLVDNEDFDSLLEAFCVSIGLCRENEKNKEALRILKQILINKEISVRELSKYTNISEPAIRYHLRNMKKIGLIEGNKTYSLAHSSINNFIIFLEKFYIGEIIEHLKDNVGSKLDEYLKKIRK